MNKRLWLLQQPLCRLQKTADHLVSSQCLPSGKVIVEPLYVAPLQRAVV